MQHKMLLFTTILLCFALPRSNAQENMNSSGGNATGGGGTVSFTVGQIFYSSAFGTNGSVIQGIQHPYEIWVLGIDELKEVNLYTIYPNPTSNFLILKVDVTSAINISYLSYSLYNISGKLIETNKVVGNETTIAMRNLAPSTYFLKVSSNGKIVKTFKIIKT